MLLRNLRKMHGGYGPPAWAPGGAALPYLRLLSSFRGDGSKEPFLRSRVKCFVRILFVKHLIAFYVCVWI